MLKSLAEERPFAVYVHWPFCRSKCPYCDFNSHVRERIDEQAWQDGLLAALDIQAARTRGRMVSSVFFGGGTPSLMSARTVGAVLDRIAKLWAVSPEMEATLEANPTSVEAAKFADYRAAGVNRLSMGVQSLRDPDLKFLGRPHDVAEAKAAIDLAKRSFDRFSFDMIYARPQQTVADWVTELDEALDLAVHHLSLYQLTIEQGTAFHTAYGRGDFALPGDELAGDLYEATQERLAKRGLPAYEISNHARPGEESRHNLVYWRYGDYVGVGPGAHGRVTLDSGEKLATRQHKAPETWLTAMQAGEDGMAEEVPVTAAEQLDEMLMMGLRLREGIPRARFQRDFGQEPEQLVDKAGLDILIEGGFLTLDETRLAATDEGRQRLNAVLTKLVA